MCIRGRSSSTKRPVDEQVLRLRTQVKGKYSRVLKHQHDAVKADQKKADTVAAEPDKLTKAPTTELTAAKTVATKATTAKTNADKTVTTAKTAQANSQKAFDAATAAAKAAVTAATTETPRTPNAANTRKSACNPAPPQESLPAIVNATGCCFEGTREF